MDPKRLVVIDGYSLLYRAFFATRYLSTSDGRPTNALFGFTSMLFTLLEKVRPHAIVVALDAPGKTFRHAEVETYKATRRETQDELKVQLHDARELIAALGIPSVEVVGFEADDVVGTISRLGEENGYCTTVVTGDLDALQLVDDKVNVLTMKQGVTDVVVYETKDVVERYGFGPEFIPDFKALKGDTSDNIAGVPGIGDKGAAELIQGFGTIESILERIEEVPPKYRKKIEGHEGQMVQSKYLATIVRDVTLEYDFRPFRLTEAQMEAARAMFERFEFRQAARRAPVGLGPYLEGMEGTDGDDPNAQRPTPNAVLEEDPPVPANLQEARSYGDLVKFVDDRAYAVYFGAAPTQSDLFGDPARRAFVAVGSEVRECSEADAVKLVGDLPELAILHDAKPVYRRLAGGTPAPRFDTLLAAYVLQSGRSGYALRDLVQAYLDFAIPTTPQEMAAALYLLEPCLTERLGKESQTRVLTETEIPLVPILAEMENWGICADRDVLREFSKTLEVTIAQIQERVFELAGGPFTIGSPKQLGEVLFEKLGIPGAVRTKTGYATGVEILSGLAPTHEIAQEVLNWRELTKLKSTYTDALEKLIGEDGRIHTTYNQTVAATGRLSSIDPNLQNIPIRTELGRGIRAAFTAERGYRLVSLDYSQIELRILAHMSEEPALVEAFNRRVDVHTVTAQQMFGLGEGEASKEQRRLAKMLNYAVLYGVSEFGLAQQLGAGFSILEAKALIDRYNERFPASRGSRRRSWRRPRPRASPRPARPPPLLPRHPVRQDVGAPLRRAPGDERPDPGHRRRHAQARDGPRPPGHRRLGHPYAAQRPRRARLRNAPRRRAADPGLREAMETALPLSVPIEVDAKVERTGTR